MSAALLAGVAAIPAAAAVPITLPAQTFATFAEQSSGKHAAPKLALYKNEDSSKTMATTVRTPLTTVSVVPVMDAATGLQRVSHGALVTKTVTKTTYSSVTTYATTITPKAELYATSGSGTASASPVVNFSFLTAVAPWAQAALSAVQSAAFTLSAVSNSAAVVTGTSVSQLFDSGTISFTRTTPLTAIGQSGSAFGGPKDNLLTVSFTNAVLHATLGSTVFTLTASTPTSTVAYSSDFLNFANSFSNDFSLTFAAAQTGIKVATSTGQGTVSGGHSLANNRATVAGQFAASAVPEPAAWTLMIAGFAMVGIRRRRPAATIVSA